MWNILKITVVYLNNNYGISTQNASSLLFGRFDLTRYVIQLAIQVSLYHMILIFNQI